MKVSTEIDNNFGYEKITQLVDNIPLICLCVKKTCFVYFNHVFRTGGPFWLISKVIKNMVVVFIRKNCIQMVFVYFAFWVCKKNFLPCPVHPAFFIILVVAISFWWGTTKNQDKNEQFNIKFTQFIFERKCGADLTLFFNAAEMSWCRTVFFNGCRTVLFP